MTADIGARKTVHAPLVFFCHLATAEEICHRIYRAIIPATSALALQGPRVAKAGRVWLSTPSVRCRSGGVPYRCRMSIGTRFELRLPREQRERLGALADQTGLSASDLARLAVRRLIADPGVLLGPAVQSPSEPTRGRAA
jgi:hypothetical protein